MDLANGLARGLDGLRRVLRVTRAGRPVLKRKGRGAERGLWTGAASRWAWGGAYEAEVLRGGMR